MTPRASCKSAAPSRWLQIFHCVFAALDDRTHTHPVCPECNAASMRTYEQEGYQWVEAPDGTFQPARVGLDGAAQRSKVDNEGAPRVLGKAWPVERASIAILTETAKPMTTFICSVCGQSESAKESSTLYAHGWREIYFCHCPTCGCSEMRCPDCELDSIPRKLPYHPFVV